MILYRVMSSYEIKKLMGADVSNENNSTLCGTNSFKYEPKTEYMHFFKYAEHAKSLISKFGAIIAKCDIPDELIEQEGFGFYCRDISAIPECIIKKENFDVNFIKGFKYELIVGWCTPDIPIEEHKSRYIGSYGELYAELFEDLRKGYYKEKSTLTINDYVANKLKGVNLDKLLLNYIDRVHEKHYPSKPKKGGLFRKR